MTLPKSLTIMRSLRSKNTSSVMKSHQCGVHRRIRPREILLTVLQQAASSMRSASENSSAGNSPHGATAGCVINAECIGEFVRGKFSSRCYSRLRHQCGVHRRIRPREILLTVLQQAASSMRSASENSSAGNSPHGATAGCVINAEYIGEFACGKFPSRSRRQAAA